MDHTTLEQTAVLGIRALIALLGDNPDEGRLAPVPRALVRELAAVGRRHPIALASVLAVRPVRAVTTPHNPHGVLDDPGARLYVGPVEFTAICQQHLAPFSGTVHLGVDPGECGYAPSPAYRPADPARRDAVAWRPEPAALAVVAEHYAAGLTTPRRIPRLVTEAFKTHLGGAGAVCAVRLTTPCSHRDSGRPGLTATRAWGTYAGADDDPDPYNPGDGDPARAAEWASWLALTTVPAATATAEFARRAFCEPDPLGGPPAMLAGGPGGVLERLA